ncbi:MAG: hypothetical protein ACIAS6_02565 [Phycisphaerales bacterium JB060]
MLLPTRYPDDRNAIAPSGWLASKRKARRAGVDEATASAALRGMNRQAGRHGMRMGIIFAVAFPVLFLVLPDVPYLASLGIAAVFGAVVGLAMRPFVLPRTIEALRTGWLAQGRCPACGTVIADVEPEEDNCRVCPECGSAWKMDEKTARTRT